ncbi:MAG: acyl-CoA/acyl-ACP dehydrogenase [Planctomycetes bacterium]|nr:acyl-CoA/acyl-ACP dehydrogenase [Planctomycetota bacterium]
MHNFELSEEQNLILDTVARFVADVAGPRALEHDEHGTFVLESYRQLAELGLLGLPVAEASGGAGMSWLTFVVALEEVARGCASTARLFLGQAGLCGKALDGVPAAADLLGEILGGTLCAFVGPESGLNARQAPGGEIVVDGVAPLVVGAAQAEHLLVAARSDNGPVLLHVPPGKAEVRPLRPLGFRAAAPAAVEFRGVALPARHALAQAGEAEGALRRAGLAACIGGAAIGAGIADAAWRAAVRHAGERIAFGKPLLAQQAVAHKLVEARRRGLAARHAAYHAARLADLHTDPAHAEVQIAAMLARIEGVEAAVYAADEAIQIHGGYGFVVEYHVERHYRDAKTLDVLDGGGERLRDALAVQLAR